MFTFCVQKDTIRVEAQDFGKEPAVAIREEIHRRYANKVIPEVGLVISLLDILNCSEGAVLYGDGCFYYKTEFRLVVFRPFKSEAIVARVASQTEEGIRVSVGFFDDIHITRPFFPNHCAFDPVRQAFFWVNDCPAPADDRELLDSSTSEDRWYIEKKDWLKIRIEEEYFDDSTPAMGMQQGAANDLPPPVDGVAAQVVLPAKAPYTIIASIGEDGLGCLDWWDDDDE